MNSCPQAFNSFEHTRNAHRCCCCTSVGFGCQGSSANAGSDPHSALPVCKGPRVPLSPCLSGPSSPVVQQEPWSYLGATHSRCWSTRSVLVLAFAAQAAWSCSSQVGRQTLATGGSRSTPALVQHAAVASVWGKHWYPFVPAHSGLLCWRCLRAAPWCHK